MRVVQMVRQPTSVAQSYLGANGQLIVDTGSKAIRVHDGVTPGGVSTMIGANNLSDVTSTVVARSNLGLVIGTNVQAHSAVLDALATLTPANNNIPYFTGASTAGSLTMTGTGTVVVMATSPTLVTPVLGVATATSINKVAITAPTTSATLTIADGKTLTVSNTLTFTGTDASSVAFGAGGTVLYSGGSYAASITGTANEITASAATGAVTLSLPTALTFTGKTVTGGTFASPTISGTVAGAHTYSGALSLSAALTYGGVTLSNAVTGTGNMVLSASPTLSGTIGGALTFSGTHTLSAALTYGGVTLTNAVTGTGKMVLDTSPNFTGPVGIGMSPVNVLDITQTQNTTSAVKILNASAGTVAEAIFLAANGTHTCVMGMAGTGFTPASYEKTDGGFLISGGAGGLTVGTNVNQPIYFWVNTGQVASMSSSEFGVSTNMQAAAGFIVGVPTGAYKGTGTANFAGDIYKNNTAYTNPDFVLEHYYRNGKIVEFADKEGASTYTGLMPLSEVEAYARENLHLPRFGQNAEHGLFSGSDAILASVEEIHLYLFDHEKRIAAFEKAA